MKIYRKEKDQKGTRKFLFGLKVYETKVTDFSFKRYLLGVLICRKKKTNTMLALDKSNALLTRLCIRQAEQKVLTMGLFYKDMPDEQRYVLCIDCLTDPYAEAIDSWTFFQYLKKKKVPTKYVLLRGNKLFDKLKSENKLNDVLVVDSELQLLADYPEIIAQSRLVLCSFLFSVSPIFRQLSFLRAVYIGHGVPFFKEWTRDYNGLNGGAMKYNGMLIPTKLTKDFYDTTGYDYRSLETYCCGLPRWDRLEQFKDIKENRSIFVFFTYRTYLDKDERVKAEYLSRISSFVSKVRDILSRRGDIQLYLSVHHNLLMSNPKFNCGEMFKGVNIVPTTEISNMIRECDMCITDFSSLAFDFMYRDVPVIFYCFDADIEPLDDMDTPRMYAEKANKFLYNCCMEEGSAIAKVRYYIERGFEIEPELSEINKRIFWLRKDNCERLWLLLNETC